MPFLSVDTNINPTFFPLEGKIVGWFAFFLGALVVRSRATLPKPSVERLETLSSTKGEPKAENNTTQCNTTICEFGAILLPLVTDLSAAGPPAELKHITQRRKRKQP